MDEAKVEQLDLSRFAQPEIVREILEIYQAASLLDRRRILIELDPVLTAEVVSDNNPPQPDEGVKGE